jgi:GT2 family glycosyltransferase
MSTPQVSVIIPVFNQWAFTAQSLRSLKEHTPQRIEVIVIDNASTDQTPGELDNLGRQLFGEGFRSVHLPENEGFARACNRGAALAAADTLFFLNNDTQLTPGWLPPLLEALDADPGLGAVGPLLLYPGSGLVQHLGLTFLPGPEVMHLHDYYPATHPLVLKARLPKALTAAALAMRGHVFRAAGGFFQGYRNGCEDIDLCLTLGRSGYRFRCEPQSTVLHFTSRSEGRFEHDAQNSSLLVERHGPSLTPDIHLHAQDDGYEIALNDWLLPYLNPIPQRRADLSARAAGADPQRWADLLEEEPRWAEGYALMADWLEARDARAEALHYLGLAAHFHPSRAAYVRLARAATRAGSGNIADHAASRLQAVTARLRTVRRQALQRLARAEGDPVWCNLYKSWLANHNTTGQSA